MLEKASEETRLALSKVGEMIFNEDFRSLKYLQTHKKMMCEVSLM